MWHKSAPSRVANFTTNLLNAVAGLPKQRLDEALDQLVRSELMFCRGEIPHAVYTFKHALVRDAAYDGLLKSRRVHLHAAIAKALEEKFTEVAQNSARDCCTPLHSGEKPRKGLTLLVRGR